ncbi:ATP-grasp domain-containing protein [Staphylococcus aureus]
MKNIPQGYQAIKLLQDRLKNQKETLKSAGTKVVLFISVKESTDIDKAIETLGYPFIVKTRFGGYDGKGQIFS